MDFAEKTGFLLTFLYVGLTTMQCSQNFDDLLFAHLKGDSTLIFDDFLGQIGTNPRETTIPLISKGTESRASEPRRSRRVV